MSVFTNTLRQSFIQMSSPAKLILLLLLVVFFMLLGSAVAILISVPLFGHDLSAIISMIENPEAGNIGLVKVFQIIQSIFLFIIPALIAAWLFSENTFDYLEAGNKASSITLVLVLASLFMAIPLMNFLASVNSRLDFPHWLNGLESRIRAMEDSAGKLTDLFLKSETITDLAVNLLMIAILPALGEEFLFRGVLQKLFISWTRNTHAGVILAAFTFSFIHFQFYGFIPRFLLGLYFGYLLVWSSSIWVPVTGHLINNGIAVIYYRYAIQPMGETAMDKIGTGPGGNYMLYISVFLTALIIGLIYQHERKRKGLLL
jgi:uncharacterized protein